MSKVELTPEQKESLKILTSEARASHAHVLKPSAVKGSEKLNYSIELLFDKKTTKLSELQAPLIKAATYEWGEKANWPSPLLLPIRDGDKPHGKKKEIKEEHKGMWVVRASSSAEYTKPYVVGQDPDVELTTDAEFYSGCYCRAALKAHAYTFADKDGVKFILDGVQFIRHGKPFGGRKPANQIFDRIAGDAGDETLGEGLDMGAEAEGEESFL